MRTSGEGSSSARRHSGPAAIDGVPAAHRGSPAPPSSAPRRRRRRGPTSGRGGRRGGASRPAPPSRRRDRTDTSRRRARGRRGWRLGERRKRSPSGRKPTSRISRARSCCALRSRSWIDRCAGEPARLCTSSGSALEVVQLLGRLRLPEGVLGRRQLPLVVEPLPDLRGRRLEHVVDVLAVDEVRHVVADVDVAAVGRGADEVVALVHPAAEAEERTAAAARRTCRGRRGPASRPAAGAPRGSAPSARNRRSSPAGPIARPGV